MSTPTNTQITDEMVIRGLNRKILKAQCNYSSQKIRIEQGVKVRILPSYWKGIVEDLKSQVIEVQLRSRGIDKSNIEWRDCENYAGYYKISNYGIVLSIRNNRLMFGSLDSEGYLQISFKIKAKGITVKRKIHRLVAQAFTPNPESKPQVNHLDFDKKNNSVSNLVWATSQEDADHKVAAGRQAKNHRKSLKELAKQRIKGEDK